jgi:exodeoxyribonuclease V alpha subunit
MLNATGRAAAPVPPDTTVRGHVGRLFIASPEFTAGFLELDRGASIRFAGEFMVQTGDAVVLHGTWKQTKWGRQFEAASFEFDLPVDAAGLANYLALNPQIKGIGPAKARIIAERFGSDLDSALTDRPGEVAAAAHVPLPVIETLRDEWLRTRAFNVANTWLAAFELTHHQVTTLVKKYGNGVVAVFKADPYRLIREVEGYAFKRVDQIARKMGTPKDHASRVRGGLLHTVAEALDAGHTWTEYEDLVEQANTLLVMDTLDSREIIRASLDALIDDKTLACEVVDNRHLVARPDIYRMERDLGTIFRRGHDGNPSLPPIADPTAYLQSIAPRLNDDQRQAVFTAFRSTITVVTGGAGSGKTFTVTALCDAYEDQGCTVLLCAPTGKAAKRMEESTGREAFTIHRLLGYDGRDFQFVGPIDADLLVVDEASMVDVPLFWHLMRAVDLARTAVVVVGDHNQLAPVGPGSVLRDLLATHAVPIVVLGQVVRQAGILKENCSAILRGTVAPPSDVEADGLRSWYRVGALAAPADLLAFVRALYATKLPELGLDVVRDVQLLTPTRKGPLGVNALNLELQRLVQKARHGIDVPPVPANRRPPFLLHDKVIQRRNNYDLGVMNGCLGVVVGVDPLSGDLTVRFDGEDVRLVRSEGHLGHLDLAYALTIHQTQGSEFPVAIVIVHKSHAFQHHRNLLYTGATRAKRSTILLGDDWAMRNCAQRVDASKRRTWLSLRLDTASNDRGPVRPGLPRQGKASFGPARLGTAIQGEAVHDDGGASPKCRREVAP